MKKIKIFNIDFDTFENYEDINENINNFFILIELELGIEGEKGSELFRFNICDIKGLEKKIYEENYSKKEDCFILNDYHIIIMEKYNYDNLIKKLNIIFEEAVKSSKDWNAIAKKLNKHFYWEYEKETK